LGAQQGTTEKRLDRTKPIEGSSLKSGRSWGNAKGGEEKTFNVQGTEQNPYLREGKGGELSLRRKRIAEGVLKRRQIQKECIARGRNLPQEEGG